MSEKKSDLFKSTMGGFCHNGFKIKIWFRTTLLSFPLDIIYVFAGHQPIIFIYRLIHIKRAIICARIHTHLKVFTRTFFHSSKSLDHLSQAMLHSRKYSSQLFYQGSFKNFPLQTFNFSIS